MPEFDYGGLRDGRDVLCCSASAPPCSRRSAECPSSNCSASWSRVYPVAAVRFVEEHGYAGPLYNHFNWGGYLIWQFPRLPVALDGRINLYGSEHIGRAVNTWNGLGRWADDPDLTRARLVIAQADKPLTSLLTRDDRFHEVYRDAVAVVRRYAPRSRSITRFNVGLGRITAASFAGSGW